MKLEELDPIEARLRLSKRNTNITLERWALVTASSTLYFEYRQDAEAAFLYNHQLMTVTVYHIGEDNELTDCTECFEKLIPKPKKEGWATKFWKFLETI